MPLLNNNGAIYSPAELYNGSCVTFPIEKHYYITDSTFMALTAALKTNKKKGLWKEFKHAAQRPKHVVNVVNVKRGVVAGGVFL